MVLELKMKNQPTEGDLDQLDGYLRDLEDLHSIAQSAHHITGRVVLTRSQPREQTVHEAIINPATLNSYPLTEATEGSIAIECDALQFVSLIAPIIYWTFGMSSAVIVMRSALLGLGKDAIRSA